MGSPGLSCLIRSRRCSHYLRATRKHKNGEAAAREEKSDETHANLVKLTKVAYRIRMGHRGAL